ncbi:MAG: PorP/SprF family type IX secretion system membrane protein [Chitinophagaceae bacterium]
MKKMFFGFLIFAFSLHANAQQRPYYTQYILNAYILNPAVAGIENYWDVKVSHRRQWIGLDGSPVTTYFTIQGPLKKSDYDRQSATSVHTPGENPRGHAYWEDYQSTDAHSGIGFTILNDATGPLNRFSAAATYAYHIPITGRTSLSGGISVGAQNLTLNTSKLNFGTDYPVDPAVAGSGYLHKWRPDISAGLWLYSADYFAGLSAQNIVPSKLSFAEDTLKVQNGKLIPHLFFTAGYRFFVTDDINFLPSFVIKYINPVPLSFDLNAKLQYRDFLWAGASYRYHDGFAAMVGINVSSTFNFGYSYDVTTSPLNAVSYGTHELVLGFLIGNHYGDWCPRNLW